MAQAQAKEITANPTVRAVLDYLNQKSSSSVPTGAICFFATTAIPTGWLLCNGSNVSRTEYAALFAAIGTKFGAGDGKTTFTLPNLDDRFIEGTTDTAKVGQYLEAGLPNITGGITCFDYDESSTWVYGAFETDSLHFGTSIGENMEIARVSFQAQRSSSIYGSSSTVQPSTLLALVCIKT